MSEGAGIKCAACSARPYPELSLPEIVRENFDLLKINGQWFCSEHRSEKSPRKLRMKLSPIGEGLRKCRVELAEIVDGGSDLDIETKERLCAVTDRLDRLAEGAADGH